MKTEKERRKIIRELLDGTDREFTDEELIHQLIMTSVTENADRNEKQTLGQRAADAVARFAGSWAFIFSFIAVMVVWMILNIVMAERAFDAYPFILLNLVKDRARAENDYRINLKSELIIDDLHKKLDLVLENQKKLEHKLEQLEQQTSQRDQ